MTHSRLFSSRFRWIYLAGLLAALPLPAAAMSWTVDHELSSLSLHGSALGHERVMTFPDMKVQLALDPGHLAGATLDVSIDLSTLEVMRESDPEKRSSDHTQIGRIEFFGLPGSMPATAEYHAIGFEPGEQNGTFTTDGELTVLGVTMPVRLQFSVTQEGAVATAEGGTQIDRHDFESGPEDESIYKSNVEVRFTVVATQNEDD